MKLIKIILAMCIVIFTVKSSIIAYSTDAYSIELPSTYINRNVNTSANPIVFGKSTNTGKPNVSIYIGDNTNNQNISNVTASDISELANSLCNTIYSSYGIKVDVIQKEKIIFNGYNAIFLSTKWNSEKVLGHTVYQHQYMVTSKKYTYAVTFSTDNEEELGSTEITNIMNSFVINDELQKNGFFDVKSLIAYGIMGGAFGVIFGMIKKKINSY